MAKKAKKRSSGDNNLKVKAKNIITDAVKDINRELGVLRKHKSVFENKLKSFSNSITKLQTKEMKLRDEISKLVSNEGNYDRKRAIIKEKVENIKAKIARINNIKEQLDAVE